MQQIALPHSTRPTPVRHLVTMASHMAGTASNLPPEIKWLPLVFQSKSVELQSRVGCFPPTLKWLMGLFLAKSASTGQEVAASFIKTSKFETAAGSLCTSWQRQLLVQCVFVEQLLTKGKFFTYLCSICGLVRLPIHILIVQVELQSPFSFVLYEDPSTLTLWLLHTDVVLHVHPSRGAFNEQT